MFLLTFIHTNNSSNIKYVITKLNPLVVANFLNKYHNLKIGLDPIYYSAYSLVPTIYLTTEILCATFIKTNNIIVIITNKYEIFYKNYYILSNSEQTEIVQKLELNKTTYYEFSISSKNSLKIKYPLNYKDIIQNIVPYNTNYYAEYLWQKLPNSDKINLETTYRKLLKFSKDCNYYKPLLLFLIIKTVKNTSLKTDYY